MQSLTADPIPEREIPDMKPSRRTGRVREILSCLAWFAVPFLIFTLVLGVARVSGTSMRPSFADGDHVLCIRHVTPDYGDVVLFRHDNFDGVLIKRVLGLPGDEIMIQDGVLYRNGETVLEPYLTGWCDSGDDFAAATVPEGCLFVMGDNRYASMDSRSDRIGFAASSKLIGKVFLRIGGVT